MNYADLGQRVRTLRKAHHMTLKMLADEVAISVSYLGHIERGTGGTSIETLVKLCNALNTNLNYLLAGSLSKPIQ